MNVGGLVTVLIILIPFIAGTGGSQSLLTIFAIAMIPITVELVKYIRTKHNKLKDNYDNYSSSNKSTIFKNFVGQVGIYSSYSINLERKAFTPNHTFFCFKIKKIHLETKSGIRYLILEGDKISVHNDDFSNYIFKEFTTIARISLQYEIGRWLPKDLKKLLRSSLDQNINFIDLDSFDYKLFELVISNLKEENWALDSIEEAKYSVEQIKKIQYLSNNNQFLKDNILSLIKAENAFIKELNSLPEFIEELRNSTRQCLELLSVPPSLRPVINYEPSMLDIRSRSLKAHQNFEDLLAIKQSYDEVSKLIKGRDSNWDLKG